MSKSCLNPKCVELCEDGYCSEECLQQTETCNSCGFIVEKQPATLCNECYEEHDENAIERLKSELATALSERNQAMDSLALARQALQGERTINAQLATQLKNPKTSRYIPGLAEKSPHRDEIKSIIENMRDKMSDDYNATCPELSSEQMKELIGDIKDNWDFSEQIWGEIHERVEDWLKANIESFTC